MICADWGYEQDNATIWIGQVAMCVVNGVTVRHSGDPGIDQVSISQDNGDSDMMSASVVVNGKFYDIYYKGFHVLPAQKGSQVLPNKGGDTFHVYAITEVDVIDALFPDQNDIAMAPDVNAEKTLVDDFCAAANTCSARTVQIMILYSTAAKNKFGGDATVQAKIAKAIAEMKQGLMDSGITHTVNLAHAQEFTGLAESGSANTDPTRPLPAMRQASCVPMPPTPPMPLIP